MDSSRILRYSVSACLCAGLVLLFGCTKTEVTWEQRTLEDIEDVRNGTQSSIFGPHVGAVVAAANDDRFINNLRELVIVGDASRYLPLIKKNRKLEKVVLGSTKNTQTFLESLPPSVTSLVLDLSDWNCRDKNVDPDDFYHPDVVHARFEVLAKCDSIKELFIRPWDKRLNVSAIRMLPEMKSLEVLEIIWPTTDARIQPFQSALKAALPNCQVQVAAP